jgi:vacuolar-type H+-ATPase subunit E/Vma4
MTTKHMTDDTSHDVDQSTGSVGGEMVVEAATEQAEDASRELLAKARYDAFRLMTEARDEAETILDEVRAEASGKTDAAKILATSTGEKAKAQAAEIVESAHEEAATIVAGAHRRAGEEAAAADGAALEAEHKALSERVSSLRTIADQLEDRFAALAKTADPDRAQSTISQPSETTKIDYSPSVAPNATDEPVVEPETPEPERDSFYNRRSANLPRLGDEGGRSALDMTRTLRQSLETE